ncbi:MAG: 23S rRNA (pseudouridine(1915)-N(3))-methyltransferase RlmH [Pseudomonadota bacterium]
MKLDLAAIGRLKAGPERDLVSRYQDRIEKTGRAVGLSGFNVHEFPESRGPTVDERKQDEAKNLLSRLSDQHQWFVFDERGKSIDSPGFARLVERGLETAKPMAFLIGGPDGLASSLRDDAQAVLSFGGMTMPHQLVRVLVLEQIYRATTILSGHPYHRT